MNTELLEPRIERVYVQDQEPVPMELDLEEINSIVNRINTQNFEIEEPIPMEIDYIPETVSSGSTWFSSSGEVAPIVKIDDNQNWEAPFPGPYFPEFKLAQYPFSKEKLSNLIALGREYPLPYDCTINSLEIMGFIDREGAGFLRRKFKEEGGIGKSKLNHCLEVSFMEEHSGDSIEFTQLYYSGKDSDILFNLGLKENHAIMCHGISHVKTGTSHSFVCYKHDGNLYVYEPQRPDRIIFNISENPEDGIEYFKSYKMIGYIFRYNTISSLTNINFPGNVVPLPTGPHYCSSRQKILKYFPVLNDAEFMVIDYQVGGEKYKSNILNAQEDKDKAVLRADILNSIHTCFPELTNSNDPVLIKQNIINYMTNRTGRFLVLMNKDNKFVSCCFIELKIIETGIFYFIHSVCTNPKMRGNGGCNKLIKFITEWYDGIHMMALDVRCDPVNEPAIRCYKRNGFYFSNGIQRSRDQVIVNFCEDRCGDALHYVDNLGISNCQMFRPIGRRDRFWHHIYIDKKFAIRADIDKKFAIRADGESYKISL